MTEVRQSTDEVRTQRGATRLAKTSLYLSRDALAEKGLMVIRGVRWYLPEHDPEGQV